MQGLASNLADFVVEKVELPATGRRLINHPLSRTVGGGKDDLRHEHRTVSDVGVTFDVEGLERQRLRRHAGDETFHFEHGVAVHSRHADARPYFKHLACS